MLAPSGYRVTIGIRHYVARKDEWIDKGEVELEPSFVERFVAMLKRSQPEALEKIK